MAPKKKAIATERKMASITVKALSVFSRSPNWSAPLELAILINEIATVPPNNSNTSETVYDDDDARDNLANYMDEVKEESDALGTEPDENDLDRGKNAWLSPIL